MSQSLESAIVLSLSLVSSLGIFAYEIPFIRAAQGEAKQLKCVNDYQVVSHDLYEVKNEPNPFRLKLETTPYVSANPQKAIETLKLAEDLSRLKDRRRQEENLPLDLPALPPGYVLPDIPALPPAPQVPALPAPQADHSIGIFPLDLQP